MMALKKRDIIIISIIAILVISAAVYSVLPGGKNVRISGNDTTLVSGNDSLKMSRDLYNQLTKDVDTSERVIYLSDPNAEIPYSIDERAGQRIKKVYSGRRINIVIIGVDSRVGSSYKHADANHILSILIDKGKIEIISVPRDTPADAGLEDSTQNKITVVRAARGREVYMEELAKIAGLDRIHYYLEAGFSQVMGILELLGFHNSGSTLQVLRSRTALGGNDYQRIYNQAQFIRQMILKHFDDFTGVLGSVLLSGGLSLVETNLNYATCEQIITSLDVKGFPKTEDDITVLIRPEYRLRFKLYDFTDKQIVEGLMFKVTQHYDEKSKRRDTSSNKTEMYVENVLRRAIEKAEADSAKRPQYVISNLITYYRQRAWFQIGDMKRRAEIRNKIINLLCDAYIKRDKPNEAIKIKSIMELEDRLFDEKVKQDLKTKTFSN